jgi:hypothetical protein
MRMVVVAVVVRMFVRMGNLAVSVGMRMICHLGLPCGSNHYVNYTSTRFLPRRWGVGDLLDVAD